MLTLHATTISITCWKFPVAPDAKGHTVVSLLSASLALRGGTRAASALCGERASTKPRETTVMSDPTTFGGISAAPAATPTETATPPSYGAFGSSRGTGLARGKRPTPTAAQPVSANSAGFQPSSIAVIRPKSEYVNPFTGEKSVGAPASEPSPAAPTAVATPPPAKPEPAAPAVFRPSPAPSAAPVRSAVPAATTPIATPTPAAPLRLNILPPQQAPRAEHSWESPGASNSAPRETRRENRERFPRRDREGGERPVFRPERSERREERPDTRAAKLDASAPETPLEDNSPGFFGWLKSLFGGGQKPSSSERSSSSSHRSGSGESSRHSSLSSTHDGHRAEGGEHRRRRRRGGRGRNRHREGDSSSGHEHWPHREGEHRHHHHGDHSHHRHDRSSGHGGSDRTAS